MEKELKKAILIPQKSTFEVQDQVYVYVLDDKNIVQMRSVIPKMRMPHLFVVESGIKKGDRIIYEGIQTVKEGLLVQPDTINFSSILNQLTQ